MQQALFFSVLHKPLTAEGLGNHGGGGAALVLPGGRQDTSQLVVPVWTINNKPLSVECLNFIKKAIVRTAVTESTTQVVRCLAGFILLQKTKPTQPGVAVRHGLLHIMWLCSTNLDVLTWPGGGSCSQPESA